MTDSKTQMSLIQNVLTLKWFFQALANEIKSKLVELTAKFYSHF